MWMTNKELVVVLPAYNEEQEVETLVQRWQRCKSRLEKEFQYNLKILVVNDGSKDQTEKICRHLQKQCANFELVNHPKNMGLGEAVKTGLTYATTNYPNCYLVCLMDCDNTQDPKYVFRMLRKREKCNGRNCDVVIASRYQKGAKVHGVSQFRLLTSEGARVFYRILLPVKNVKDYTCGYRMYTKEIIERCLERYGDDFVEESGFSCMAEILYKIHCIGGKFCEIPFELHYDEKSGESKMKVGKTIMNSIKLAVRLRRKVTRVK